MEKNEVGDIKEIKKEKAMVHIKGATSAHNLEDFVSTAGVIIVSITFILYVAVISLAPGLFTSKESTSGRNQNNQNNAIFPFVAKPPDCKKMNGDFDACVKSQTEGSGCSWYAECNACIVGSHDGRSREELCGK